MLSLQNITYSPIKQPLFQNFSLDIQAGSFVSIVGPSGVGKSTLLKLMSGLLTPQSGTISYKNKIVQTRCTMSLQANPYTCLMFQEYSLYPWLTLKQNIEIMLSKNQVSSSKYQMYIDQCGLQTHLSKYPHELSGGQKQRGALVRSLLSDKPIVLMDEPLGALDEQTKHSILQLFRTLKKQCSKTFVMVTHHTGDAALLSDQIISLEQDQTMGVQCEFSPIVPKHASQALSSSLQYTE
jgi:ABC-type nitrate/sulfonate/bicarbonate transport system ATPase subunit